MPTKIKQIKKTRGNINKDALSGVSSLFDNIFGNNPILDPDIIFTRCEDIKKHIIKLKQIIEIFYNHTMINDICTDNTHLTKDYNDIYVFINELNNYINEELVFEYTLDDMKKKNITLNDIMHENSYDDDKARMLTDYYKKIKNSEFINVAIELLKNMQPHKKYINDDCINECKWLETLPGHTYEIFPFSSLNIKFVYMIEFNNNNDTIHKKKFIANLLNKIYKCCVNIHNLITDIDFDISKFTDIILNNIDSLKKELPRCDDAFDVISHALHKIKSNFKYYYKDFEITNDPTIIIQKFIKDIYDDNKNNPVIISQLKKIISHFSNKIKTNTKVSPQVSNLIDNLNDLSFKSESNNDNASASNIINTIKNINHNINNHQCKNNDVDGAEIHSDISNNDSDNYNDDGDDDNNDNNDDNNDNNDNDNDA